MSTRRDRRAQARQKPVGPSPAQAEARSPNAPLSARTRRVFTAVMVLLPVLFFVLLEGGLRLAGYGADYPLFTDVEGYPDVLVQNRDVARRYFAQEQAVPNANADYFARTKPANGFRLVAMGESSTAGFPFYWGAAFPRVLGNRLRAAHPERKVEVINTAMAAVNSYTFLDFADEVVAVAPDAVVLYLGHNEYYGALGAASAERFGRNPRVVRGYLALKRFRTVQLVRSLIGKARAAAVGRQRGERPNNTLMARMVGEQSVPLDSDLFRAGERQFRENLDALLAQFQAAGVPVFIGTLVSNERDQRPFVTVHAEGADVPAWERAMADGHRLLDGGDAAAAIGAFRRATEADSGAADGWYYYGRSSLYAGSVEDARRAFRRAKDLDALRFRAPEQFNAIIREVASARGATVVDTEGAFQARSPNGLVGHELMLEHLHPTLDGYSLMADAFFEAMEARGVAGPAGRPTPPANRLRLVTPVDSLVGLMRIEQLMASWPFRPDEARPLMVDTARTPPYVVETATALFRETQPWQLAMETLASQHERAGRWREALLARRALAQAYPFVAEVHTRLGAAQMQAAGVLGRPALFLAAERTLNEALERDARSAPALGMLGALLLRRNAAAEAVPILERAEALAPRDTQVLYNLSGAYALAGRTAEARTTVQRLIALEPGNSRGPALLSSLPPAP